MQNHVTIRIWSRCHLPVRMLQTLLLVQIFMDVQDVVTCLRLWDHVFYQLLP